MPEKKRNEYRRKVFRVGGSVVVPIPKKLRQDLGLVVGDRVRLSIISENWIVIKKEGKPWDGSIKISD